MKNGGLSQAELTQIVGILESVTSVDKAVLFGSRAMGLTRSNSDVDIMLYGDSLKLRDLMKINRLLEETTLPYQFDLVRYDANNSALLKHVKQYGKVIFQQKVSQGEERKQWKVKLGETDVQIIDGDRGKNYPNEFTSHGYCLFLNAKNVTSTGFSFESKQFITQKRDELLRKGKLIRNDVVLTTRGTVGNVAFYDDSIPFDNVRINSGMVILRPAPDRVNPTYLYYVMKSSDIQEQIVQLLSGSAQPQFPISHLVNLELPLPPLPVQKKISCVLKTLDDKIAHNTAINRHLERMTQVIFKSWFMDFIPWGGVMPKDWTTGKAEDFFTISIGKTPPRKEPQWFSSNPHDVIWVSISDMGNCGMFISDSSEYLTAESIERFNIKVVPSNTVLLSFKLTVGRVAITNGEMTTNDAIAHFKCSNDTIREYLYCYLKTFEYQLLGSTSSIATAVNSKTIKAMPFIMPDDKALHDFHATTFPLFEQIKVHLAESARLAALRDTILPRLMSGALGVGG